MDESANVVVHESAFPARVREHLLESLRRRELEQKFLYMGLKQAARWLALHECHSPARQAAGTKDLYDQAFAAAGVECGASILHLVGLAAGGGQKETSCLESLRGQGKTVFFTPCDVSLEMVMEAHQLAASRLRGLQCTPILCDLPRCSTLPALLKGIDPGGTSRVVTFFGTIHNFLPSEILPRILNTVRSQDLLLLGANLAPSLDYEGAVARILPQYENRETEDWLFAFLGELGIGPADGKLCFEVAEAGALAGLKRIEAVFRFGRKMEVAVHRERVEFAAGESLRLFYSFRFTKEHIQDLLSKQGLQLLGEWISSEEEEGVFLCWRVPQ